MGYALVALATLLGMSLQSAVGFGFVFLLGPALFAVLPPAEALTVILSLGILINSLVLFGERRKPRILKHDLVLLLVTSLPGLLWGVLLLQYLPRSTLQALIGIVVIVGALIQMRLLRHHQSKTDHPKTEPALVPGLGVGLAAGVLTTSTGLSAPPLILWLVNRGARGAYLRDTINALFLGLNIAGGIVLAVTGSYQATTRTFTLIALLIPLVLIGHSFGAQVFQKIERKHYEKIILAGLLLVGLASLLHGVL